IHLVAHPTFGVERDSQGQLKRLAVDARAGDHVFRESFIHIHVERIEDSIRRTEVVQALESVLAEVRMCVQDWRTMLARVGEVIADLKANPPPMPVTDIAEAIQFLQWLVANNFTFLGVREYAFVGKEREAEAKHETSLGLLRGRDVQILRRGGQPGVLTPEHWAFTP